MPAEDPISLKSKSWLRLRITVNSELADLVADLVCRQTGGVEQLPDKDGDKTREQIIAYLNNNHSGQEVLRKLEDDLADLPGASGSSEMLIETEIVPDEDWNKTWKERFQPFAITPRLVIKPSWEAYQPGPSEKIIELDPGMAFGTGHHASTKLALAFIEDLFHSNVAAPVTVLDVGTGTGILAMAAALFGADEALAIDNDPEAVTVARENIARNNLQKVVTASDADLEKIVRRFDLVIANIIHDTLIELAAELAARLAPKGKLILAGILAGPQTGNIRAAYTALGLIHQETRSEGEWSALLFAKP